jgi:hypothetical protein
MKFKVGDYVSIKEGTELETGETASGWAGKVIEMDTEYKSCLIELDAITLNGLSDEYLLDCIEEGAEPFEYAFEWDDLVKAERRDTEKEKKAAVKKIDARLLELEEEEDDEEYIGKLEEEWIEAFQESQYFTALNEYQREKAGFVASTFMSYMYNYEDVLPMDWDVFSTEAVLLGVVPRKVTAEIEFFENYGDILIAFLRFLGEKEYITDSEALQDAVRSVKDEIPKIAGDSSNWGIAKALFMTAKEEGYDLKDQEQINTFINLYNQRIQFGNFENLQGGTGNMSTQENPSKGIGRNDKITVRYGDGTVKENVKFKLVEEDLSAGKCVIVKK